MTIGMDFVSKAVDVTEDASISNIQKILFFIILLDLQI